MSLESRLAAFAQRVAEQFQEYVTLDTDQTITGAKRFTSGALPHPPITRSLDANPPLNPQIDDLWIVPDANPATSPTNFAVGSTNPGLSGQGIWIQTGLGPTGEDYTIWIEDGS